MKKLMAYFGTKTTDKGFQIISMNADPKKVENDIMEAIKAIIACHDIVNIAADGSTTTIHYKSNRGKTLTASFAFISGDVAEFFGKAACA